MYQRSPLRCYVEIPECATCIHTFLINRIAPGFKTQSNYAAANGILDAIAEPSLQMGIACQVIQWGAWAGPGMASIGSKRLERIGIRLISPGGRGSFSMEHC